MPGSEYPQRPQLPWDTLKFVLAAGGVALLFLGVGWWLARRALAPAAPEPFYPGLAGLPTPKTPALPAASSRPPQPRMISTVLVGSAPVELVSPSTQPRRHIVIATDQPIRVGKTADIGSRPELGVPVAAGNLAFDWGIVGRDERLFAVAAPNGSSASVTVLMRLVE